MRTQTRVRTSAALAVALVLAASSIARAQPPLLPGAQPTDPRIAQIRSGLEERGLTVLEVSFHPADATTPAYWAAVTQAGYAQPSFWRVVAQAVTIWMVMTDVLRQERPQMLFLGGQVWTKYLLMLTTERRHFVAFVNAWQAARTDAERERVLDALLQTVFLRVYDIERQQFVDERDFMNKNFVGG